MNFLFESGAGKYIVRLRNRSYYLLLQGYKRGNILVNILDISYYLPFNDYNEKLLHKENPMCDIIEIFIFKTSINHSESNLINIWKRKNDRMITKEELIDYYFGDSRQVKEELIKKIKLEK